MKLTHIKIEAWNRKEGQYIDSKDIEALHIGVGGVTVIHKGGQFTVPEEGVLYLINTSGRRKEEKI